MMFRPFSSSSRLYILHPSILEINDEEDVCDMIQIDDLTRAVDFNDDLFAIGSDEIALDGAASDQIDGAGAFPGFRADRS